MDFALNRKYSRQYSREYLFGAQIANSHVNIHVNICELGKNRDLGIHREHLRTSLRLVTNCKYLREYLRFKAKSMNIDVNIHVNI